MNAPVSAIGTPALREMVELARAAPPGCFVEVGVWRGGSAWYLAELARQQGRDLHLFDTFTGIPWSGPRDRHLVGDFDDTTFHAVIEAIPDATFYVGVFPYTLPEDLFDIAFIHSDCDQEQSVKAVIEHLWPRLVPGGTILFDDYDNLEGERWAINSAIGTLRELRRTGSSKVYAVKEG